MSPILIVSVVDRHVWVFVYIIHCSNLSAVVHVLLSLPCRYSGPVGPVQ